MESLAILKNGVEKLKLHVSQLQKENETMKQTISCLLDERWEFEVLISI